MIIGFPMEIFHKPYKVWLIFLAGTTTGALAFVALDFRKKSYLVGSSNGVYAILLAQFFHAVEVGTVWVIVGRQEL